MTNQSIIAADVRVDIGTPVVLWDQPGGFVCPNKRGRAGLSCHDPILNDQPTRPDSQYRIIEPGKAYGELKQRIHQFVLHYDVCYCSYHCHQVMKASPFKGSHFYLDLDGTIYQTCDLYWKTNTAPADDRMGNLRSVHVEISNLSSEALASDSTLGISRDLYKKTGKGWKLRVPEKYRDRIRAPDFKPVAARAYGDRGYFSRRVNGDIVRMWDYTEEQYQALIRLCFGVHRLLPKIALRVPFNARKKRIPMEKIRNFATFSGILGHCHIQAGTSGGVSKKIDPGSAFNWGRLRRALKNQDKFMKPRLTANE